jgi:hypothetical protein
MHVRWHCGGTRQGDESRTRSSSSEMNSTLKTFLRRVADTGRASGAIVVFDLKSLQLEKE